MWLCMIRKILMNSKQDLAWYVKHRKEFLKLPDEKPFFKRRKKLPLTKKRK